jgi:hypothetical protein
VLTYTSPLGRVVSWRACPMVSAKTVARNPAGTVMVSTAEVVTAAVSAEPEAAGARSAPPQAEMPPEAAMTEAATSRSRGVSAVIGRLSG